MTPNLLAREERERERALREECEGDKRADKRRVSIKRPHEDVEEAAAELNGAKAEKRMKVLHPTAPTAPEGVGGGEEERSASAQDPADAEQKPKPDTALVRLSSGRVVRVPIEILRQHQEQVLARRNEQLQLQQQQQQQQQQLLRHTNGVSGTGLQNADQALSRVLARISPSAMPTGQHVVRAIPPAIIRQNAPQITLASHHQAKRPSPDTNNGIRLQQRQALQQQRVVRIRANPGPSLASGSIPIGLSSSTVTTPNGLAKLSERLNLIEPLGQPQFQPQQNRIITAATSATGQSVRVRCYAGASTIRSVIPVASNANPSRQRLSVALNSVTGQRIQTVVPVTAGSNLTAGVQRSAVAPVERVIRLVPKPIASGQLINPQQNGQQSVQHHRVQLAPIFDRQAASSSKQGAQQPQAVVLQGPDGSSTAAAAINESLDASSPRRNVRLVELVQQQPGGKGGQLVTLGGGQIMRATAANLSNATAQPPGTIVVLRNSAGSTRETS